MRFLFDMQYYQGTHVSGTSLYHAIMDFADAMPIGEHFVYVMLPAKDALDLDWYYDAKKEFDTRKVKVLEAVPYQATKRSPSGNASGGYSDEELQWLWVSKHDWYYDAIIVCRQFAMYAARSTSERSQKGLYRPAILAWVHDPITEKKKKDGYWDEFSAKAELFNMQLADGAMFYMQSDKDEVLSQSARKWLAPTERIKLAKSVVIGNPINFGLVDKAKDQYAYRRDNRKTKAVGFYNSFWVAKRPKEVSLLMDTMHRLRGMNAVVTSMALNDEGLFQQPFVEKHLGLGRLDYLKYLFDSDIVFVLSMHETGGRSYWESLIAGAVLVIKLEDWNRDIVPEWYPYKSESIADMEKLALVVVDDLETARKWADRLAKHIRSLYDHTQVTKRLVDYAKEVEAENCIKISKTTTLYRTVEKIVMRECLDMFTIDMLNNVSDKYTKDGRKFLPSQFLSYQYLCKVLLDMGFEDTYEEEVPVFRRRTK